ncbi:MAG: GNAT family N-acetyltransferase, partial [Nitrospira sp.]|nr:GNAT family N-acetyltransferase [Nitrospira sp.]
MSSQPNGVWTIDPLRDDRWPDFVARHPKATVFHTRGWLKALQATYGYEPLAFTTSAPSDVLNNAIVCCAVRSWLTGRRLVSLPFSDHCEPLVERSDVMQTLCTHLESVVDQGAWKYIEIRSADPMMKGLDRFTEGEAYVLHRLDLRPDLDALYTCLHKDCLQRKIRRAERSSLEYIVGRSPELLRDLYGLLQLTRARHHVPPQPFAWFHHLVACAGEAVAIRVVYRDGRPLAGMLTLRHGNTMVYKYGGSDTAFHQLGCMPFLFWQVIKEAKDTGAEALDLGRSDLDNPGLMTFKDRWSAVRTSLVTWRMSAESSSAFAESMTRRYAKRVMGYL